MKVFLSPEFLNHFIYSEYFDYNDNKLYKRPFEILKHAEDLMNKNLNGEYISDAIININRAISFRLKDIKHKFNFDDIPYIRTKDLWSRLEELGLIRKHLINEINKIRNLIEHEDKGTPTIELCKLYFEFTWYFLKATNLLCIRQIERVHFEIDNYYWANCEIDFKNKWQMKIFGWFENINYSYEKVNNYIEIDAERIDKRIDIKNIGKWSDPNEDGRGKNDTDIVISGIVIFTEQQFTKMYNAIFSCYQDT
jgi:hypothetical protein